MKKLILIFLIVIGILLILDRIFLLGPPNAIVRYDKYLGWSGVPNGYEKDRFGKNVYVKINGQGFRNNMDFDTKIPNGRVRIICSGDSYTFGPGVSNDDVWGEQLMRLDKRLEVINMGFKAYGIDQAYLWYLRDGVKFEHNIHIFGIIDHDFARFGKKVFGYNKPILNVSEGQLRVANVPVPRRSYLESKWDRLRTILGFYHPLRDTDQVDMDHSIQLALEVFEDLKKINDSQNSRFIVVYFPMYSNDYSKSQVELRGFLRQELQKRNIEFIDLTNDFNNIPQDKIKTMFIFDKRAGVHYSAAGNRFVAGLIYEHIAPYLAIGAQSEAVPLP